jgi:hypothetical protein
MAEAGTDTVQYDAEFFAQFSPRTALDMVRQVPGFSLQEVDEEKRGYAAAAGNVLIDGEYPNNKSQTLEDILQRIPATQVVRIELRRSGTGELGSNRASVLANIVRTRSAGSGVWGLGAEYAQQHEPAPNGYVSWTGRAGNVEYALGGNAYSLRRELPSTHVLTDSDGQVRERQYESSPREFSEYAVNAEASRALLGGTLRATGQAYRSNYEQHNTLERRAGDDNAMGDETAPYEEGKRTFEFGTSFETASETGKATLAAIVNRTRFDSDSQLLAYDLQTGDQTDFRQLQLRDTGESIARGSLTRRLGPRQELEFGAEGALNTLDAALDLSGAINGEEFPIAIPNANLQLEETRWSGFILHRWHAGPWSTETSLAAERSRLKFSGDSTRSVHLKYLKPSFQLARSFAGQQQWRFKVYREVGQLDFADFASVMTLSDDLVNGGNPDLKPENSWRVEAALDLRFSALAASIRAYHYWISDVVDFVAIESSDRIVSAPGNLGSGSVDGVQVSVSVPLASLIPHATLKVDATLQEDRVTDSLTHRVRPISDFDRNKLKAEFRQDTSFHGLSWGIKYARDSSKALYRTDEIDRTRVSPSLDVFAEMPVTRSLRLNVSMVSVQGEAELRSRTLYRGDRTSSVLSREEIARHPGHWWLVTLSSAF